MKRLLAALSLIAIICSCSQEQFDVSSLSLRSENTVTVSADGSGSWDSSLILSAAFSLEDDSYSFSVKSPGSVLSWEGVIQGSGIRTAELEITDGARFPEGTYTCLFYSDQGTECSSDAVYQADASFPIYGEDGLTSDAYVTEYDKDGNRVAYGERRRGDMPTAYAASVRMEWTDRYSNRYTIIQYVR